MPQAAFTQQAGLWTSPNPLPAPPGALAVATNTILKDAGILEPRRGFSLHSALANASRVTWYQNALLAMVGTTLKHYGSGAWSSYAGSFSPPDSQTPTRFLQAAKCLYFTTAAGIYKLDTLSSVIGAPTPAGVPQAMAPEFNQLHITAAPPDWLPANHSVAYRTLLLKYDRQGNLLLGRPSERLVAQNTSGGTAHILVDVRTPAFLCDTSTIVRLYRSVSSAGTPSDELFLVTQHQVTASDLSAGYFTFTDLAVDASLGVALYTNASQQGIAQGNDLPPLARDFCAFKGTTIYANTVDRQRASIVLKFLDAVYTTVLGITVQHDGLAVGDTLSITDGTNTDTYTAGAAENASTKTYWKTPVGDAPVGWTTAQSLAKIINLATKTVAVRADYNGSAVNLASLAVGAVPYTISFDATVFTLASNALVRTGGNLVTVTQNAHPYQPGMMVHLAAGTPDANFPVGDKLVTTTTANTWTYAESGSNATSSHVYTAKHLVNSDSWAAYLDSSLTSSDSADSAGLAYSKLNQPDAVPLENSDTVGDFTQAILRVVPLRDSVLIFKADGVYRLTGTNPSDFVIQPYDLTVVLAAPETAQALSDNVLFLAKQGPMGVSESGGVFPLAPQGFQCPIRETLLALLATTPAAVTASFAVSYESEKQYLLWVPNLAGSSAAQAFVWHAGLTAWTGPWTVPAAHAIVDSTTGKLTLVDGTNVLLERKDFADSDYQDVGGTANITAVADSTHIVMAGPGIGDLVTQGGSSARVLAVGAANALTLDAAGSWSVASATYARAITSKFTYLPWAGGEENAGAFHKFSELAFNFRTFSGLWVNVTTSTDMDPTEDRALVYGRPSQPANVNIRAGFSRNKGSGVMLSAGMEICQAVSSWQLQSTSLVYQPLSTRTPRQMAG